MLADPQGITQDSKRFQLKDAQFSAQKHAELSRIRHVREPKQVPMVRDLPALPLVLHGNHQPAYRVFRHAVWAPDALWEQAHGCFCGAAPRDWRRAGEAGAVRSTEPGRRGSGAQNIPQKGDMKSGLVLKTLYLQESNTRENRDIEGNPRR